MKWFTLVLMSVLVQPAGGQTWEPATRDFGVMVNVLHVTEAGTALAGVSYVGIFRLEADSTWKYVSESFPTEIKEKDGLLYAATLDGLLLSRDEGRTWSTLLPAGVRTVYLNGSRIVAGGRGGQVYESLNYGTTWTVRTCSQMPMGYDDTVWAVFSGNRLMYSHYLTGTFWSEDDGASWQNDPNWTPFFFRRGDDGFAYASDLFTLRRSVDGQQWEDVATVPVLGADQFAKRGPLIALASPFGAAYSTDAGTTWTEITNLPGEEETAYAVAIDAEGRLYVGTSCCVRRTTALSGTGSVSAEKTDHPPLPDLRAIFPNPAVRHAQVSVVLDQAGPVRVEVFDVAGRRIGLVVDRVLPAGVHKLSWEPHHLAPGAYFIRMTAGGKVQTRTVTLVR